jgi:hypothetical protein
VWFKVVVYNYDLLVFLAFGDGSRGEAEKVWRNGRGMMSCRNGVATGLITDSLRHTSLRPAEFGIHTQYTYLVSSRCVRLDLRTSNLEAQHSQLQQHAMRPRNSCNPCSSFITTPSSFSNPISWCKNQTIATPYIVACSNSLEFVERGIPSSTSCRS